MKRNDLRFEKCGSITVETTFMMIFVLAVFVFLLHVSFYFYDRCVMAEAAYETSVWQSVESRITKYSGEEDSGEIAGKILQGRNFFYQNPGIFTTEEEDSISVTIEGKRGVWKDTVSCNCSLTKPENFIRIIGAPIQRKGQDNGDNLQTGSE